MSTYVDCQDGESSIGLQPVPIICNPRRPSFAERKTTVAFRSAKGRLPPKGTCFAVRRTTNRDLRRLPGQSKCHWALACDYREL